LISCKEGFLTVLHNVKKNIVFHIVNIINNDEVNIKRCVSRIIDSIPMTRKKSRGRGYGVDGKGTCDDLIAEWFG